MARKDRLDKDIAFRTELLKLAVLVQVAAFGAALTLSTPPTTSWRTGMGTFALIVGLCMTGAALALVVGIGREIRKLDAVP